MELTGKLGATKVTSVAGGLAKEFRDFLLKQNALALAIGVVIGAAIGKVVTGIVDDIIMPFVGLLLPGGEWRTAELVMSGQNSLKYGDLLGKLVDFVIVSAVVFFVIKAFIGKPAPAAPTKQCPECLETIPAAAHKCRACSSQV